MALALGCGTMFRTNKPARIIISGILLLTIGASALAETTAGLCEGLIAASMAEFNSQKDAAEKFIAREQISQIRALGAMFRSVTPELRASLEDFEKSKSFDKDSRETMKGIGHFGMSTAYLGSSQTPGVREGQYKNMPESWIAILQYEYAKTETRNVTRSATMEVGVHPSGSVCSNLQELSSLEDPFLLQVTTCTHLNLLTGRFDPRPEAMFMIVDRAAEKPVTGAKLGTELKENEKAIAQALSDYLNAQIPQQCRKSFEGVPESNSDDVKL